MTDISLLTPYAAVPAGASFLIAVDDATGPTLVRRTQLLAATALGSTGGGGGGGPALTAAAIAAVLGYTPYNALLNASGYQTQAQVAAAIQAVVGLAPAQLSTLQAIAAELVADEGVTAALTAVVGGKLAKSANLSDLASPAVARTSLGLAAVAATGSYADLVGAPATLTTDTQIIASTSVGQALVWPAGGASRAYDITMTANVAFSSPAVAATGHQQTLTLWLRQDGVGGRTPTFPAAWRVPQGQALALSSAPNALDVVQVATLDGGASALLTMVAANLNSLSIGQPPSNAPVAPNAPGVTLVSTASGSATFQLVDGLANGAPITSHHLYQGTSSGAETLVGVIAPDASGNVTVTSLTNAATAFFQFTSSNSAGESTRSVEVSATPQAAGAIPAHYAALPGGGIFYTSPSQAANPALPAGVKTFSLQLAAPNLASGAQQAIAANWSNGSPGYATSSFLFALDPTGHVLFAYIDTLHNFQVATSSAVVPAAFNSGANWLVIKIDDTGGKVTFYTSADGSTLQPLGTQQAVQASTMSNPSGTSTNMVIGATSDTQSFFTGSVFRFKIDGPNGSVLDLNFGAAATGATTVADSTGRNFILGGNAAVH